MVDPLPEEIVAVIRAAAEPLLERTRLKFYARVTELMNGHAVPTPADAKRACAEAQAEFLNRAEGTAWSSGRR